jgi:hypothetical protein
MGYKPMLSRAIPTWLKCGLMVLLALRMGSSQEAAPEAAKDVLLLSEAEQRQFVNSVLNAGFPEKEGDRFSLLLVNRSVLVLPLLESRIEQELKRSQHSERLIELACVMIAYAGNEESLRAIGNLIGLDEARFGPLVGRTFDNAGNWRNPFTVAYRGLELGNEAVSRHTVAWVASAVASDRMRRNWAEAMLDRYGKVPGDSEWATDPIVSRLEDRASPELRQSVGRFAAEVQRKRERQ